MWGFGQAAKQFHLYGDEMLCCELRCCHYSGTERQPTTPCYICSLLRTVSVNLVNDMEAP